MLAQSPPSGHIHMPAYLDGLAWEQWIPLLAQQTTQPFGAVVFLRPHESRPAKQNCCIQALPRRALEQFDNHELRCRKEPVFPIILDAVIASRQLSRPWSYFCRKAKGDRVAYYGQPSGSGPTQRGKHL